jgi:hypothetical protein
MNNPVEETPVTRLGKLKSPPSPSSPALLPTTEKANGEVENEDDYFYLSSPILVEGKEITRLLLNPKGILKGKSFFSIIRRYQNKFPDEARTSFNKFTSENFLSLVLAEINKIAPEDLAKIDYTDLPLLFLRAASFHFSGGVRKAATPEETEA